MLDYVPPAHIAVINASRQARDSEVAFWVEAVRLQLQEAARLWGLPPPGMALYDRTAGKPPGGTTITIVDNGMNPGAGGYHHPLGGVVDMAQSILPSRTLSHEALEILGNYGLDRWVSGPEPRGGGQRLFYAEEWCDMVQRDGYGVQVTLAGIISSVEVSNFALPAWFDYTSPGPYDYLGRLAEPFALSPGGYVICKDDGGQLLMKSHPEGALFGQTKFSRWSRTRRIAMHDEPTPE